MKKYIVILMVIVGLIAGDFFVVYAVNDEEVLTVEEESWLLDTKQVKFKVGYPSSVTPLNYFYFYSSLKGVITDIAQEFSELTDKTISTHLITDTVESQALMDYGIIDLFISGKKDEYEGVHYSSPIHEFEYSFYVNRSNSAKNTEALVSSRIGVVDNDDNIWKYLSSYEDVKVYSNYISLYEALSDGEIDAVFVPGDLLRYQSLLADLREVKSTDYLFSEWYFVSSESNLISILDKVMSKMQTMERYSDYFFNHQNALVSKLYNLDKKTYEWLFYENPVLKVGIYDAPPFMYYDDESDSVSGVLDYILKQIHTNFGVQFEFVYGDYNDLMDAYKRKEIDILPFLTVESSGSLKLNGSVYEVYQGELNAYGQFNQVTIQDALESNGDTKVGSILSSDLFNDLNVSTNKTIGVLYDAFEHNEINYLLLDPIYLDYFGQYDLAFKGKVGKYIFSFLVQNDQNYNELFTAINLRDFQNDDSSSKYETALSTEMYLYEMSMLKNDLYSMHQQQLMFLAIFIVGGSAIAVLIRMRYLDKKTEYLKYTDPATGVLNRLGYMKQMDKVMENGKSFAYIIMDIDHFKTINDTYGHLEGDKVIAHVADVLRECCPEGSMICRLGGDEFVICLMDSNKDVVVPIVKWIQECMLDYSDVLKVTSSIGIAINDGSELDLEKIYQRADYALYESKNNGRNQFTIFSK